VRKEDRSVEALPQLYTLGKKKNSQEKKAQNRGERFFKQGHRQASGVA